MQSTDGNKQQGGAEEAKKDLGQDQGGNGSRTEGGKQTLINGHTLTSFPSQDMHRAGVWLITCL